LADGATGSNLFDMGLMTGDAPELWNVDEPEKIKAHYQAFIDAGSDIVLTNTFGGTRYRLKLHKAQDRVEELNVAGTHLLKECIAASGREVLIAGSMGPTGEILEPSGPLTIDEAADAFAEQALALKKGGVDVLWVETISSNEEMQAALKGCAIAQMPVVTTLSIDTNGRTMMGLTAADVVENGATMQPSPYAIGTNCGVGASEVVAAILNMRTAASEQGVDPIIIAKANCGVPEYIDGEIVYNGTPQVMSDYVKFAIDAGANIIGGCCGTTPGHVAAMRKVMDEHVKGEVPTLAQITDVLGEVSVGAQAQLRGEMSVEAGATGSSNSSRKSRRRRETPA
jgi:methionine synthase I (cobalamin-dependent)